jgi:hypothetical protein
MGKVLNLSGEPVPNAKVEIWQANAHGRYTHPSDPNTAPLDPNFDGSALLVTDSEGRYRFTTIKPAAYPRGPNAMRPAHIHFQVSGKQDRLVTQMYFEADPYNPTDPFLNSAGRKELLIKKILEPAADLEAESKLVMFDIVLYKGWSDGSSFKAAAQRTEAAVAFSSVQTGFRCLDRIFIDAVLPPRCLACGETVGEPDSLCGRCWSSITFFAPPWCANCGYV